MSPLSFSQKPLFSALSAATTALSGRSLEQWVTFAPGTTPMSTFTETAVALAVYYTVVFGGKRIMKNREPFKLEKINLVHNAYLTLISGALLALFVEQLVPTLWNRGVYCAVCNLRDGWTDQLVVLYYLNYLTKYLEFLDTCILMLRKKPLTFLHTYHHGATALLCYVQLTGLTPVSWVPITLNLAVHCVMYFYYLQSARGIRIWWKKYITTMQIAQFVLDLGFVYYTTYNVIVSKHFQSLPHRPCAGGDVAAGTGCLILTSYLFLFISFYFSTYKRQATGKATAPTVKAVQKTAGPAAVKFDTASSKVASTPLLTLRKVGGLLLSGAMGVRKHQSATSLKCNTSIATSTGITCSPASSTPVVHRKVATFDLSKNETFDIPAQIQEEEDEDSYAGRKSSIVDTLERFAKLQIPQLPTGAGA